MSIVSGGQAFSTPAAAPKMFLDEMRRRLMDGPRARHVAITLLGDYWLEEGAQVPSGALVELLGHFGVQEAGARSMLNRLRRDGRVEVDKQGRRTSYALSEAFRGRLLSGAQKMAALGVETRIFDGQWTCVAFSIPEDVRALRHKLRTALTWLGCAPLYDGLWVSPRVSAERAKEVVRSMGIESATVIRGQLEAAGVATADPISAWDLESIASVYREFLAELEPQLQRYRSGELTGVEALVVRTEMVNVWRIMPRLDPDLPLELLPSDWPRRAAWRAFDELYQGLADTARSVVVEAVARADEAMVTHVHPHSMGIG